MAKRGERPSVARNVYFYRLENFPELRSALAGDILRIGNLPFSNDGRYLVDRTEGDRLVIWPDSSEYPLNFRFGRTRLANLPSIEQGGHLRELSLEDDAGLSECCHISIFADGTVAAEFNFDGPRISQLSSYLFSKKQALPEKPTFRPLLQHDILQALSKLSGATLLKISGPPSAADRLREADSHLGAAFDNMGRAGASKTIDVNLLARKPEQSQMLKTAKALVAKSRVVDRSGPFALNILKVKGLNSESGKIDTVDLLQDHLISNCHFPKKSARGKAISSTEAYRQLEAAYLELLPDLERAARALPVWS